MMELCDDITCSQITRIMGVIFLPPAFAALPLTTSAQKRYAVGKLSCFIIPIRYVDMDQKSILHMLRLYLKGGALGRRNILPLQILLFLMDFWFIASI